MPAFPPQHRVKLQDSRRHGADTELLLVEGDSAADSVAAVRDDRLQAVLPLQGKPLNAWTAPAAKVNAHALYQQLAGALGLATPTTALSDSTQLKHGRLVLLFDPDADGIHIGALLLLYLKRWQPQLLSEGRVTMVRAPMAQLSWQGDGPAGLQSPLCAHNPTQLQALRQQLAQHQPPPQALSVQVFRGLGSVPRELLREHCVAPATRHAHTVGEGDVAAVVELFGAG